jgi:hypothetical protein
MPHYTSKPTPSPARWEVAQAGLSLVALAALSACSPPAPAGDQTAAIRAATIAALPDIPADQLVITDFSRSAAKSTWKVTAAGKSYSCDADELLRLPACKAAG